MSDERNSIKPATVSAAGDDTELQRRNDIVVSVNAQFNNSDGIYQYKNVPDVPAFIDHGDRLTTELDNDDVALAMAKLAESKGWTNIVAQGSEPFYANVERYSKQGEIVAATKDAKQAAPDAESNTVEANRVAGIADDESERKKSALLRSVQDQYRVAGGKYYFKDHAGSVNMLAFKDAGLKLTTALNTERVTRSLVELAESKGWDSIKVSGHADFKRQVWREAVERGIEVRGYKPTQADLETVQAKAPNTVEQVKSQSQVNVPEQPAKQGNGKDLTGVLIAHGAAKYMNKPDATPSYYATIQTDTGERTQWGVDLERAISEANVQTGERVSFSKVASKPVTVQQGNETVAAVRNSWVVTSPDREQQKAADRSNVIQAVSDAVAADKGISDDDRQRIAKGVEQRIAASQLSLSAVQVYDNQAAQSPSVAPTTENERTRKKAPELIR